ncbi:sigma-70 family RNA polymerase sigma factor [Streptomyces sp. RKND-216]|uniref:Sigma-70 family RNA polymerase sigma factor n=1 Tax=Streptomyces hazeniae TaxID=3075538 RepID=A0ABU2NYP5_9ACTN|nr:MULTISPECIES: ECF subfamily RNA polymerase sigma factor, BldN family [unclassified Streptomyces]MDT0380733.1 sigma-70 family RNA polymerase sigma factor [Streptomyces sp. DSM 42041]THA25134.1 sigma-70 family RNA polymerase sigma factor [Streptomyces sp. RKND-216]
MYPHVGVDASGLATLRTSVVDRLRTIVPTAYAVPALAAAAPVPARPCYALADSTATGAAAGPRVAGRRRGASGTGTATRGSSGAATRGASGTATRRRPAVGDTEARRMMDLVERAQNGEADAFGRLYDQYSDTVYRYIYYRVGGRATAEDLTSETFLRALRRIGTFTWQGRDFGAWLVTIARNLVADHFKSSRFRLEVTTGEMLDANEVERSPEDSVLERLSNDALIDAVRRLNPQQQECVTLRFLHGLTVAETARIMGKNEGAIKTLQYRAVRTLARLMPEDVR